jgi:spoIIIJ-associated protein
MKKIEAPTLEEAYKRASHEFNCSITELTYEIIQYPTSGVMGLFKKNAIIVVAKRNIQEQESLADSSALNNIDISTPQNQVLDKSTQNIVISEDNKETKSNSLDSGEKKVLDTFFENSKRIDLSLEIEEKIKKLMDSSCFDIDTVKVDVIGNIAYVFIDGKDAALLIGKEGYRYNALSYMLFNWINDRYGLYLKLEIAEFIKTQEEMIENYLKPIVEHIQKVGRGKTKPLDGILVQIALEKLREKFPNKYVAIKTSKDNKKFIVINNFNTAKS